MFRTISSIFVSAFFFFTITTFTGCDTEDAIDYSVMDATIADAEQLYNSTDEGTLPGQFPADARTTLKDAINIAKQVRNTETVTQIEVDNAVSALQNAIDVYGTFVIGQIVPENLVLYLPFNANANDASGNGFDGTPKAGHIDFGAGDPPSLTTDRYGNDNGAYHFEKGGNIEIPYNQKFNPEEAITISLWFNKASGDDKFKNIVMALSRRFGYMMQVQSKYLYTTFHCVNDYGNEVNNDEMILDYPITEGEWNHYAVSYTDKSLKFYMNGAPTGFFDNVEGKLIQIDNIPLTIGSDLPTGTYTTSEGPYYIGFGGYFTGEIDDVRIYDVQLSDSDIEAIYTMERP